VALVYAFCVAFRLWRFVARDKEDDTLSPGVFNGLPSPAGALVALGACLFWQNVWVSSAVILFTSFLLVSHVRFVHFRNMLRHVPRNLVVMFGFVVVFIIGYLIKVRDSQMLGAALLAAFLLYALTSNSKSFGRRMLGDR
jgi:CDP-diacylglycerol--serine O-phosphatidyltransferase